MADRDDPRLVHPISDDGIQELITQSEEWNAMLDYYKRKGRENAWLEYRETARIEHKRMCRAIIRGAGMLSHIDYAGGVRLMRDVLLNRTP